MPFVVPLLRFSFSRVPLRFVVNVDTSSHLQPAHLSVSLLSRRISSFLVSATKHNKKGEDFYLSFSDLTFIPVLMLGSLQLTHNKR